MPAVRRAAITVLLIAGCSPAAPTAAPTPVPTPTTSPTTAVTQPAASEASEGAALAGSWRRLNSCPSFVQALKDAALWGRVPDWLLAGYWPSASAVPATNPCVGVTEVEHDHFFTEDGQFGSHDEHGAQVDHGTYELIDGDTIAFPGHAEELGFGPIVVGFEIDVDDRLTFEVTVPSPCDGACVVAYGWAISAFYPATFERVQAR